MSAGRPRRVRAGSTGAVRLALTAVAITLAVTGCTAAGAGPAAQQPTGPTAASTTAASSSSASAVAPAALVVSPPLGTKDFAPVDRVTVRAQGGTLTEVTVLTPDGTPVAGALSRDRTTWTAGERLGYDRAYTVAARAVNAEGAPAMVHGSIGTATPVTLTYASAIPNPDLTDVGVGQPIALYFDEDVTDRAAVERRLTVTSTPPVEGAWNWYSDREVHYRPTDFWPAGAHVVVDASIYGVNVGNGIYGQEDRHLEFDVHDQLVAKVDNAELQLRIYRNGELVRTMPTAMGKPGNETYSGTYVVMDQHSKYTMDSSTYGVPIDGPDGYRTEVEFASRLSNTGVFVHAAPWSVPDQGIRNVSHGCLNVSTDDAQWFYENFGRGDIVEVSGTGVPLAPTDGFGDWNISWADWQAGSALT